MRHLEARDTPPEAPKGGPDGGFTQPPTVEIGAFSLFRPDFGVPLPFRDREEDTTARWVGLESPSRPAVALSFVCWWC